MLEPKATKDEEEILTKLMSEYTPNDNDTDESLRIKEKIWSMPESKRRIFLMWVDCGNFSEVARQLNCSPPTIGKYIKKVIEEYKLKDDLC